MEIAERPHKDFDLDVGRFAASLREAVVGVAMLFLTILAFALTIGLIVGLIAGGLKLFGGLRSYLPLLALPVVLVGFLGILYTIWMASCWGAVSALEELGLGLHGKAVKWVIPVAPAVAILCGPLAFLARLGRDTERPLLVLGMALVLCLAVLGALQLVGLL